MEWYYSTSSYSRMGPYNSLNSFSRCRPRSRCPPFTLYIYFLQPFFLISYIYIYRLVPCLEGHLDPVPGTGINSTGGETSGVHLSPYFLQPILRISLIYRLVPCLEGHLDPELIQVVEKQDLVHKII